MGKELAYYLTIFKIEGHQTWRAQITGKNDIERQLKNTALGSDSKAPAITDKRIYRIDRLTGELKLEK